MIKCILGFTFGLTLLVGVAFLAAVVKTNEPDSSLVDLFCIAQVVVLGGLGLTFMDEWATELKTRMASAKSKRRTHARRL